MQPWEAGRPRKGRSPVGMPWMYSPYWPRSMQRPGARSRGRNACGPPRGFRLDGDFGQEIQGRRPLVADCRLCKLRVGSRKEVFMKLVLVAFIVALGAGCTKKTARAAEK